MSFWPSIKETEEFFEERFKAAAPWYKHAGLVRGHSQKLAKAARMIAEKMCENGVRTIDPEQAYIAGLLHDIGKTVEGWSGIDHPVRGYELLNKQGWTGPAKIAMTHTYYGYHEINRQEFWDELEDKNDLEFTKKYMEAAEITDLDRLIQLVDNMANADKVMTVSDRFCDIVMRHNLHSAAEHLKVLYALKMDFDRKAGMNIYELFRKEIIETAMMEPNEGEVA